MKKLDPENHSGAVLSVFWSLFGAPKATYHILEECVGPCWTGGDCGKPLGPFGRYYRAQFRDFDSFGPVDLVLFCMHLSYFLGPLGSQVLFSDP